MRTVLNEWNHVTERVASDQITLEILDLHNKTRYSRRKNKEGLLELASREAHEKKMTYFATMLKDDNTPYCAISAGNGYFGVDFLADNFANYLLYDYRDNYAQDGRLFLGAIILYEFLPGTTQSINRIDFVFSPQGEFRRLQYLGEKGAWASILEEFSPISEEEFSLLWVDYPEFGKYEELIRLDRIPLAVREEIFKVTDKEYPAFREHLQRDIEKYQSK